MLISAVLHKPSSRLELYIGHHFRMFLGVIFVWLNLIKKTFVQVVKYCCFVNMIDWITNSCPIPPSAWSYGCENFIHIIWHKPFQKQILFKVFEVGFGFQGMVVFCTYHWHKPFFSKTNTMSDIWSRFRSIFCVVGNPGYKFSVVVSVLKRR